jgi:outer membrane protein assembly factor BamB
LYVDRDRYSPSISAYDAYTGASLWDSGSTSTTLYPPPVIANGILYGANGDCGNICAYALPAALAHR